MGCWWSNQTVQRVQIQAYLESNQIQMEALLLLHHLEEVWVLVSPDSPKFDVFKNFLKCAGLKSFNCNVHPISCCVKSMLFKWRLLAFETLVMSTFPDVRTGPDPLFHCGMSPTSPFIDSLPEIDDGGNVVKFSAKKVTLSHRNSLYVVHWVNSQRWMFCLDLLYLNEHFSTKSSGKETVWEQYGSNRNFRVDRFKVVNGKLFMSCRD